MKKYTVVHCGKPYLVTFEKAKYHNGNLCIRTFNGGKAFLTMSINLPESNLLPPDVFYAKNWTENNGIVEQLVGNGAIERVYGVPTASSGFINEIFAYRLVNNK